MQKNYTTNQLGAIATLLGGTIWVVTAFASGESLEYARPELGIPILFPLILIPLYIMRKRPAFILGIINSINGLIMTSFLSSMGGAPPWYKFTQPLLDSSFAIVIVIMIANIYFSFKTYKELGAKARLKPTFTNHQVGAISTLLAMLIWGITSQGFEVEFGIMQSIILVPITIGWILLPLYIQRIKPAFIIGPIISVLLLIGFSITHSLREQAGIFPSLSETSLFSAFTTSLYYLISSIIYLDMMLCIFFSYLTYKELK